MTMHRGSKILMVANDPADQRRLREIIGSAHPLEVAAGLEETLHKVVIFDPHLVLIHLARADSEAQSLCRAIRGMASGNALKILLASQAAGMEDRRRAFEAGANDVLPKPFTAQELVAKIKLFGMAGATQEQGVAPLEMVGQFASVIENTPLVAIKGFDTRGVITHWNKTCEQIYGYSAKEAVGRRPRDFFQDEGVIRQLEDGLSTITKTGQASLPKEWSIHTRTGEKRWLYSTMFPVFERGVVNAVFCMDVDITRRIWAEEDRRLGYEKLRRALNGTIKAMALTVETRDLYTAGHMQRVAELAQFIASEMGMTQNSVDAIRLAGSLHDIGKISIPAEILSKPRQLSPAEFALVKEHPQVGYDILKPIEFPWPLADIVLQHHECLDGSGYPLGISGETILIEASIITVADVVESISNHRPYRPSLGLDLALEEIRENRGIKYHPAAVDACVNLFLNKSYRFDR
jgi:PAS domain S-box-containing protein/putative nucleotidyltransferase with HDIG domain